MNTRIFVLGVIVLCCCGVALGATINREGSGGLWSAVNQWDPNQVPVSTDDVIHGALASDVMTYDSDVNDVSQTINSFSAIAGSSRGLIIDDGLDLEVIGNFTRSSGTGAYVTELMDLSELTVEGTIVRGDWIVNSGATVVAGAISLGSSTDTEWDVSGLVDVDGDISFSETDVNALFPSVFLVDNGGELLVGGDAHFDVLRVEDGGSADVDGDIGSNNAIRVKGTLVAGSAGTSMESPALAQLIIEAADVTIEQELRVGEFEEVSYITFSSNSLSVHDLNFAHSASRLITSTSSGTMLDLSVSGDMDVLTTVDTMQVIPFPFRTYGVTLNLNGNSDQDVEIWTPDYDVNTVGIVWQGVNECGTDVLYNVMPLAGLVVESGASVDLTDENENILRGNSSLYTQDALYVDGDVTVQSGATLDLGSYILYYTGTLTEDGTITGTDAQVTKVCFGDFNADGDVDSADVARFGQEFSGTAVEADDPLFSSNLDGDVDLGDYAILASQFTGANVPCPVLNCGESGGGEPTI